MKFSYRWLQDFVEVRSSARELADTLTMAGLEVKGWEEKGGDTVFEAEITSNRPDWLSLIGIAREVAAINGCSIKPHAHAALPAARDAARFSIERENDADCPLYTARIITGARIGPSPAWLRERLEAIGCRSVNNVVDITNYVLYELGEPLHAFDLSRLGPAQIRVRRARAGESIVTIDGLQRSLSPEILVIADGQRPIAVAGVMGGKDTEVTERTTDILLEAALFNAVVVRRGRQRLGMQSEAAYRFERGVDAETALAAAERAAAMILQVCGGTLVQEQSSGRTAEPVRLVTLRVAEVNRMLGLELSAPRLQALLQPLGFMLEEKAADTFEVTVPAFRQDVKGQIDLIEEAARIYGFARIPVSLPKVVLQPPREDSFDRIDAIKQVLVGLGLTEVITYSLVERASLSGAWFAPDNLIVLQNPLNQDQEVLRPVLWPSLARCVAHNLRQQQSPIAIFEIAKGFALNGSPVPGESYRLAAMLCGARQWLSEKDHGCLKDEPGFLHLKGIIEVLFERLGFSCEEYSFAPQDEYCCEVLFRGAAVGMVRLLDPACMERNDIKNKEVFALELSLDPLLAGRPQPKTYQAFARFPGILRDISLVVAQDISAGSILGVIRESAGPLLQKTTVVNFYRGQHIPEGHKNLTVSCFYCSDERTLSEEDIAQAHARVIAALQQQCAATFR